MKFKFLLLFLFGLVMVSCGDDEPDTPEVCDTLQETIIGIWESDENPGTTVEFTSGGRVVDDSFLFVDDDFPAGETVNKIYNFEGTDRIEFTYSSGLNFRSRTGTIQDFSCETFRIAVNSSVLNFTKQ
ncbi:MAG: hypothetical protein AAGA77_18760 [Bacteroidota bacterium]